MTTPPKPAAPKPATKKPATNKGGRPTRAAAPAKTEELALRRSRIAELRRQGMTWHTIANREGISYTTTRADWQTWIESLDPPHDREQRRADLREQYELRLQRYTLEALAAAKDGDLVAADKAERRALSILEALRKLDGLDQPVSVDVTTDGKPLGASPDELRATTAAILAEVTHMIANPTGEPQP